MGYSDILDKLKEYRTDMRSVVEDGKAPVWFASKFSDLPGMADSCSSDAENSNISAGYRDDSYPKRIKDHVKLDYVLAMRKEIRRQYMSGESDPFTDVTPFRHAYLSVNAGMQSDELMDGVLEQIKG